MEFRRILEKMLDNKASDLHIKVGSRPQIRVDGSLMQVEEPPPSMKEIEEVVDQILTPAQKQEFLHKRELDFAISIPGFARFRVNCYFQRGTMAIVLRHVPLGVPAIEQLNLPPAVEKLALLPRGLVLVTGSVGSGKSTTLAAMIDCINRRESRSIITVEDPIEFLHRDDKSLINQREVGLDTADYLGALKHILRQDPDAILLGEIRDRETMSVALMAADTGHLVFSTLHTIDAAQTINRIISFYPPHQHNEVRFLMSMTLQAIVSQRLIPRAGGKGRVPAVEVLINTPTVQEYLMSQEKTALIRSAIQEGASQYGMQTFDQSLMRLYRRGLITLDDAIRNSSTPTEFELRIQGIQASSDSTWDAFEKEAEAKTPKAGGNSSGRSPGPDPLVREPKQGPQGIVKY